MPDPESREDAPEAASRRRAILIVWIWARICAALGVLVTVAIVADIVYGLTRPSGDTGGAMGAGIILMTLFSAWVPLGLFSLIGALLSLMAWRHHPSRDTKAAFWLCLGTPIAGGVLCGALWLSFLIFDWF
jgi:hypothetical protein